MVLTCHFQTDKFYNEQMGLFYSKYVILFSVVYIFYYNKDLFDCIQNLISPVI